MSAPGVGLQDLPELPLPSTGKPWSAGDNKFATHLPRRVTGFVELACIALIEKLCLCSSNEEFLRGTIRAGEPVDKPTVNSAELKKSRVCVPLDTFMSAIGCEKRAIQMALAHATHDDRRWLGTVTDKSGNTFLWPQPENYATGELRKCRRVKREKKFKQREASLVARETLAAFEVQPSAAPLPPFAPENNAVEGMQPSAQQPSAVEETNVTAQETRTNGEYKAQPSAPEQSSATQPGTAEQPRDENRQPTSEQRAAECPAGTSCPYVYYTRQGNTKLASQAAQPTADGEEEAKQFTEALPELVAAFGPVTNQTALNLIAAARLATVLLVISFLRRQARERRPEWWRSRTAPWGAAVGLVRDDLSSEVARTTDRGLRRVADPAADHPHTPQKLKAYLESSAAAIAQHPGYETITAALLQLASDAANGVASDLLDPQLAQLETEMIELARDKQTPEDLRRARETLEKEIEPYRAKMTAPQIQKLETQSLDRQLVEACGLPRLTLFYMK